MKACADCQSFWAGQCYAPQNAAPDTPGGVFIPHRTPVELRGHGWLVALVFGFCGWNAWWWRARPKLELPPTFNVDIRPDAWAYGHGAVWVLHR